MLSNEALELLRQRVIAGDPTVTDEELNAGLDSVTKLRQTSGAAKAAKDTGPKIDVMALLKKVADKKAEGTPPATT